MAWGGRAAWTVTTLSTKTGYRDTNPTPVSSGSKYLCRHLGLPPHRPYRNTRHIQLTLKKARHLKRKCYDSLPFLTSALCPQVVVPTLGQQEKLRAIQHFKTIDLSIRTGPFVSYLFCLEYILKKMGREDLCNFINRIQCPKRRAAYQLRLDQIFQDEEGTCIKSLLHIHG